jgi:hypothetical protein
MALKYSLGLSASPNPALDKKRTTSCQEKTGELEYCESMPSLCSNTTSAPLTNADSWRVMEVTNWGMGHGAWGMGDQAWGTGQVGRQCG